MKIMWKPESAKADDIIATVVNTATLSVVGVANGRTVPVVILQPDDENKIDAVITAHFWHFRGKLRIPVGMLL